MNDFIKGVYQISVALAVLIATLFSLDYYIGTKIDSVLSDPEVINKIASELRPSLILNLEGSVIYDIGGLEKLTEPPKVEKFEDDKYFHQITLSPKSNLKIAPLVECINDNYNIEPKRGPGNTWQYKIESEGVLSGITGTIEDEPLFRVEIIK